MGFTPKDWINEADHAGPPASPPGTPFSAVAMEDVEIRVTDYASLLAGVDAGVHNVKDYGAVGDGSDDTTDIQSAISACGAAGGGIVYFPPGTYGISDTLLVNANYVSLIGAGSGAPLAATVPNWIGASVIKWIGSAQSTKEVVEVRPSSGYLPAFELAHLSLNGNDNAGIGLGLYSNWGFHIHDFLIAKCSVQGLLLSTCTRSKVARGFMSMGYTGDSYPVTEAGTAIGIQVGEQGVNNCNLVTFDTIFMTHHNGAAFLFANGDHNHIRNVTINRTGTGTAVGIDIQGSDTAETYASHHNEFWGVSAGAGGLTVRGVGSTYDTYMPNDNYFHTYMIGNAEPLPTIENGPRFFYELNGVTNTYASPGPEAFREVTCGTYSPTLVSVANCESTPTVDELHWMQIGNRVTVEGKITYNPTSTATETKIGVPLPVTSNFGNSYHCSGQAVHGGNLSGTMYVVADPVNDRAEIDGLSSSYDGAQGLAVHFTYRVI